MAGRSACDNRSMPITDISAGRNESLVSRLLTFVDHLQLRNEVESNLAELIFEQEEEQGKQVFDSSILAEQWCETRNLLRESSSDVLG